MSALLPSAANGQCGKTSGPYLIRKLLEFPQGRFDPRIGRVLLVISYINRFRHFANCSTDYVVICDNICPVILVEA